MYGHAWSINEFRDSKFLVGGGLRTEQCRGDFCSLNTTGSTSDCLPRYEQGHCHLNICLASNAPGHCVQLSTVQILEYFGSNMKAAPEVLGDPQRESPEEILDRYNRVVASTLLSIASFSATTASGKSHKLSLDICMFFPNHLLLWWTAQHLERGEASS